MERMERRAVKGEKERQEMKEREFFLVSMEFS